MEKYSAGKETPLNRLFSSNMYIEKDKFQRDDLGPEAKNR
jgi:hypothetical protein